MTDEQLKRINDARKGNHNVAEIIPHCFECGALFEIPYERERRLINHESITLTCECGAVNELSTQLTYFSYVKPTTKPVLP